MDNNRQKMVADSTFQLISNAIKYSNPKATVTFALDDANRSLTITDTGCGISAADLPRVFRPFIPVTMDGSGEKLPVWDSI